MSGRLAEARILAASFIDKMMGARYRLGSKDISGVVNIIFWISIGISTLTTPVGAVKATSIACSIIVANDPIECTRKASLEIDLSIPS